MTLKDLIDMIKSIQFYDDGNLKHMPTKQVLDYYIALRDNHKIVIQFLKDYIQSASETKIELANRVKSLDRELLHLERAREKEDKELYTLLDGADDRDDLWLN